ncbi:MAG TPA: YeeE/YedE family protein [Candidatus Binatia bacterium]|nr:YeeE/YedE family protein [Candidatus Binatia bacterium]
MGLLSIGTALFGGALIGGTASGLLLFNGRIAGISGIVAGLLSPQRGDVAWRLSFVLGLLAGGAVLMVGNPSAIGTAHPRSLPVLAIGGLLVGVGTRVGSGCTSGHGVCGLARRSARSLVATVTFMTTGALAVYLFNHLLAGYV